MSKRDLDKSKKKKNDGFSAYEIYHKTAFLLWPVLLWLNDDLVCSQPNSKKSLIIKTLKNKADGLYFFTPGNIEEISVLPLNGTTLSKSKHCMGFLNKVQKSFQKKFANPDEWKSRINSRLRFLKVIIANYEHYKNKTADCLALEEQIFFATSDAARPSHWLSTKALKEYDLDRHKILRDIILTQRKEKVKWSDKWEVFIKKAELLPSDFILRLYQSKAFPPYTLKSIYSFDGQLLLSILEEMKLNGELFPEALNQVPLLFSELQNFILEPEIRACLCRDFVHNFLNAENNIHTHSGRFYIQYNNANKFVKRFLEEHLKTQDIETNRENYTVFDSLHWFSGVHLKKTRKQIYFPTIFPNTKLKDSFAEVVYKKCIKLIPKPNKKDFFEITKTFLQLLNEGKSSSSLLSIIGFCREFCPPGSEGKNALKLANFILSNLLQKDNDYTNWVNRNLNKLLLYTHNTTMDGQFHSPEFERSQKVLKQVLDFAPKVYKSKLSERFLSDPKLTYTLMYISPKPKCMEWILEQGDDWLESSLSERYNWDYVLGMPEEFAVKVLKWGAELRKLNYTWDQISEILYCVEDLRTDTNEANILANLESFKVTFDFSEKMNDIVKKKYDVETPDTLSDICGFYEYIDKLENGWENISILMPLFYDFIENYIKENKTEDYSVYQGYYKINWVSTFKVPPKRTLEILQSIPIYHNSFFETTFQPLIWLAKNNELVFNFLNEILKDRESFNRIIHLLKMLKVSLRLSQSKLTKQLKIWSSCSEKTPLKELKHYRKLANFSTDLPGNIRKISELPERLNKEKASLQNLSDSGKISKTALQRLNKVKDWLKHENRLAKNIQTDLDKLLPEAIANAKMDSLREISETLCKEHWRTFATRPVEEWNDDWRNALQLSFMTNNNKRILRKLMINAAGNDFQWIYYHPKNVSFLKSLPKSFDSKLWLTPPELSFKIGNKTYKIEAERNLLKILQMGNYFGSCLSVGDMNDFSTIANAVEINKHVLWIKNSKGKIVGRKLIVLNQFGELYGYNSYGAALGSQNAQPWFKIILDLYCQNLMKLCGGELCNKRKEEDKMILFSKWYDDGIERFDGWVMDIQRNKTTSYIAKKVKFKQKPGVNLRAVLWLKTQGVEIYEDWNDVKQFQNFGVDTLSIV